MTSTCFHLAFPIHDFNAAKKFYIDGLGCKLGRESKTAIIFNLGNNQIVGHKVDAPLPYPEVIYPRHFGLIFPSHEEWESYLDRAKRHNLNFFSPEKVRYPGLLIEHSSFFLVDPSNNLLEFKYYPHEEAIFGGSEIPKVGEVS